MPFFKIQLGKAVSMIPGLHALGLIAGGGEAEEARKR